MGTRISYCHRKSIWPGKSIILHQSTWSGQSWDGSSRYAESPVSRGIRYLAGSTLPLKSTAPESVHIGLTASASAPGQYILSLVNTTSGPGRPVQQLIPVYDITVTLHLPFIALKNYVVLNSAGPCQVEQRSDIVHIAIDRLEDFCAISIEMEWGKFIDI